MTSPSATVVSLVCNLSIAPSEVLAVMSPVTLIPSEAVSNFTELS